ncbi:MAG: DUF3473 domain-containing protein [Candidatus Eisenbacteria bacterium]|nr:DUF3473 domain-containing protein [Candidatus Eisenbacteria bacterium]
MRERGPGTGALTVDVEEYFHATLLRDRVGRKEWEARAGRAGAAVERLLRRFEEWDARATFFVLGWLAEREPDTIRAIAAAGHEIACHGYDHALVHELGPERFRADLRRSRDAIGAVTGRAPSGYRAPTFSITRRSLWAFPILIEEGFRFDSSVFPIRHDRYGIPGFPRRPVRIRADAGEIIEFPLSTRRLWRWNLPVSGGGYLRLLPFSWIRRGFEAIRAEGGTPVLYLHPWEIDPDQPRVPLPLLSRFRHYHGIEHVEERLGRLIEGGDFLPMGELIDRVDAEPFDPARLTDAFQARPSS